MRAKNRHCFTHIFFHPDYTVGFGVSPNQRTRKPSCPVADCTASGEFHPALKTLDISLSKHIIYCTALNCNPHILVTGKGRVLKKFIFSPYANLRN